MLRSQNAHIGLTLERFSSGFGYLHGLLKFPNHSCKSLYLNELADIPEERLSVCSTAS